MGCAISFTQHLLLGPRTGTCLLSQWSCFILNDKKIYENWRFNLELRLQLLYQVIRSLPIVMEPEVSSPSSQNTTIGLILDRFNPAYILAIYLRSISILSFHSHSFTFQSPRWSVFMRFSSQNAICISASSHSYCMYRPSPWFNCRNSYQVARRPNPWNVRTSKRH
jgi:hypothetical protein